MNKMTMAVATVLACLALNSFGAPLTAGISTPQDLTGDTVSLTVASNVIIYAGGIVCVDAATGYANPGADTSGYIVMGKALLTVDNRTAVYDASRTIQVRRGIFRWNNYNSITATSIGSLCYVANDNYVASGSMTNSVIAGTIFNVDSLGVWVDTKTVAASGAATPSSVSSAGNGSFGGNLAVTGNSVLTGNESVGGTRTTTGLSTLNGGMTVKGAVSFSATTQTVSGVVSSTAAETRNGTYSSTNGYFKLTGLPTATNGLVTGQLWNNGNVIDIMP